MNFCSYFIENKALFGSFPTQKSLEELETHGVRYFINLTCKGERRIKPYSTKYNYIHYPIIDRNIPKDWKTFALFILKICQILDNLNDGEKIYIHCRGGHGRSGVVVACILCYYFKISSNEALRKTNEYHNNRIEMRDRWRKMGSPQNEMQKVFVRRFFDPLYYYSPYKTGRTIGFSNFSPHPVFIENFGTFPTSEAAFNAMKNPTNKIYVEKQLKASTPFVSKRLGRTCILRSDWNDIRDDIMYDIIKRKFNQNIDIKENIINTGFRKIVMYTPSKYDNYWGNGKDGTGENKMGQLLMKLRDEFYQEQLTTTFIFT